MYCNKCGKEAKETDNFCTGCGNKIKNEPYPMHPSVNNTGYQPIERRNGYQATAVGNPEDTPTMGWFVLSFLVPIAGLVLYCIWSTEAPKKAKYCLKGFITSIVFYVVVFCCLITVGVSKAKDTPVYYDDDYFYSHVVEIID